MQQTPNQALSYNLASFSPHNDCLFRSEDQTLVALNVSQRIVQPAVGGEDKDSLFQAAIQRAFELEKQKGNDNPIIVGSVPFDVTQPSCLYIPQTAFFVDNMDIALSGEGQQQEQILLSHMRSEPDEASFKDAVCKAVNQFALGALEKTVLSRVLNLSFSDPVSPRAILASLWQQNPQAYHFSVPQTQGSVLLGASPELLIRKQGTQLISNPLAGSAKRQSNPALDQQISHALLQSSKDRYEHRLVIEEIARLLKPHCQQLDVPTAPSLINTPAMWHLSTRIEAELGSKDMNALQLACLLHPTPAVCGYPFDLSKQAIAQLEPFQRGMFSGMVGWCDSRGNGEWVVTIRCGEVKHDQVRLFAGAGIVNGSCSNAEWLETQAKFGTMLKAFGFNEQEAK
ncbi:isochorismate synthase [Motilimonas cestriensis]|uniref:isochorismate synthase n=1 Tax=Motilimonas cestriensis TaxID=2742685 RepID=A0ABS8WD74_9GAMM|nr:isochorismate synthase [Motilimonas cestriensis]MCE2597001.1 isochorismate synthase [Motilimonas cestriensis]